MKTFTEKLMGFVEKRDAAVRSYRKCTNCGREQVQLISYLGGRVTHKCRKYRRRGNTGLIAITGAVE